MGYHIMKTNMEEEQEKIELWIISAQEKKRTWEKFELGKKKKDNIRTMFIYLPFDNSLFCSRNDF